MKTFKSPDVFKQDFFNVLSTYGRRSGEIVYIEKKQMLQSDTILDMRAYIDASVEGELIRKKYQYIPTKSTCNCICLLDLTHRFHEYENCIDEIAYNYNFNSNMVEEVIVDTKYKD